MHVDAWPLWIRATFFVLGLLVIALGLVYLKCGMILWKEMDVPTARLGWFKAKFTMMAFLMTWPVVIFLASLQRKS